MLFGKLTHLFRAVRWIRNIIIGHNSDSLDAQGLQLLGVCNQICDNRFYIWTMISDESSQQTPGPNQLAKTVGTLVKAAQSEIRGFAAKVA